MKVFLTVLRKLTNQGLILNIMKKDLLKSERINKND